MENLNGRLKELVDELVHRGLSLEQARREFERQFIIACLELNEYNICRSAEAMGVHRNTLRNKSTALDISVDSLRADQRRLTQS